MANKVVYVMISSGSSNHLFQFVRHYCIFVTDGVDNNYVYQCTLDSTRTDGGCIIKTDYAEYLKTHTPFYYFKTDLTESDVLAKIAEIDNKRWLPLIFTCSDFTRRITKLSPFWSQKNQLIGGLTIIAALIIVNKYIKI